MEFLVVIGIGILLYCFWLHSYIASTQEKLIKLEKDRLKHAENKLEQVQKKQIRINNQQIDLKETQQNIKQDLQTIKQNLIATQQEIRRPPVANANHFLPLLSQESKQVLNITVEKLLDIYQETLQLIEPFIYRVNLVFDNNNFNLESNLEISHHGKFWSIYLAKQGHLLLPKPGAFKRQASWKELSQTFNNIDNEQLPQDPSSSFHILKPAILEMIRQNKQWKVKDKGMISWEPNVEENNEVKSATN